MCAWTLDCVVCTIYKELSAQFTDLQTKCRCRSLSPTVPRWPRRRRAAGQTSFRFSHFRFRPPHFRYSPPRVRPSLEAFCVLSSLSPTCSLFFSTRAKGVTEQEYPDDLASNIGSGSSYLSGFSNTLD